MESIDNNKIAKMDLLEIIRRKSRWVRSETLRIHKIAPGIRIASALSCIELLCVLYYGGILRFDSRDEYLSDRDRFIISKAHGTVSFYPILADLGFFNAVQLSKVGKKGSILGDIPDCSIPGFETINGSLGHGLGVACGMALGLKAKGQESKVFVLSGDGELNEGSVWEAIMFAGHNKISDLILIIDNNKICMLDYCKKIIALEPLEDKFEQFGWQATRVDGHDVEALHAGLSQLKSSDLDKPKVLIADTVKGKGVPRLESDSLCHIKALNCAEIETLLVAMEQRDE
ncbi:MAG: transketolase [Candidatus Margulisiibacteriota bacterium]